MRVCPQCKERAPEDCRCNQDTDAPSVCATCGDTRSVKNSREEANVVGEEWSERPNCSPAVVSAAEAEPPLPQMIAQTRELIASGKHELYPYSAPTKAKPEGRSDATAVRRYQWNAEQREYIDDASGDECTAQWVVNAARFDALLAERDRLLAQQNSHEFSNNVCRLELKKRDEKIATLTSANEALKSAIANNFADLRQDLLTATMENAELRGDLNIARLERDAKLCSECPRTAELSALRIAHDALKLRAERGRELLGLLYDKWENGTPCYEDVEECTGSLGNAFKLTDEEENGVLAHLATGGGGEHGTR